MPHKDGVTKFMDSDLVRTHLSRAGDYYGQTKSMEFFAYNSHCVDNDWSPALESHLEAIFWIWWRAEVGMDEGMLASSVELQTQVEVNDGRYRLDFVIALREPGDPGSGWCPQRFQDYGIPWKPIVVEVDGHAFHEKTPEQVSRRNERDRYCQQQGWTVFHFNYEEFTSRPEKCIQEVAGFAHSQLMACISAVNAKAKSLQSEA